MNYRKGRIKLKRNSPEIKNWLHRHQAKKSCRNWSNNIKKTLIIILLVTVLALAGLASQKEYGHVFVDEIVRVYDGDTFFCNVHQWPKILGENIGIRINDIDTPEMRGSPPEVKKLAQQAKAIVYNELANSEIVILKNIKRGKYFRVVADVECDGKDLAQVLIDAGLAKRYDGGTKNVWTVEDVNSKGE